MFMDRVKAGGPAVLLAMMLGVSGLAGCATEDEFERRGEGYYGEEVEPGEGAYPDSSELPGQPQPGQPGTTEPSRNPFDENY